MHLSIIIVNYNTKDLLKDCLQSIFKHIQNLDYEVIVIDNASSDGSVEMIKNDFLQVKLFQNQENLGFAKANNQGVKEARGSYILLLNSDTVLQEGDLSRVINYMDKNDSVGILGCRISNPDGSLQLSCYKFPAMKQLLSHNLFFTKIWPNNRFFGDYRKWPHDKLKEVDFVIGAFFLVKRRVFDEIGLLDEDFFLNVEETEFCLRAKKVGWRTVFYPNFQIIHYGGQSKRRLEEKSLLSSFKGTELLIRKHYGKFYILLYRFISILTSLFRLFIFGVLRLFAVKRFKDRLSKEINFRKKIIAYQLGLIK